jgi:hypothetical protein
VYLRHQAAYPPLGVCQAHVDVVEQSNGVYGNLGPVPEDDKFVTEVST